jgi:hypothetical protein
MLLSSLELAGVAIFGILFFLYRIPSLIPEWMLNHCIHILAISLPRPTVSSCSISISFQRVDLSLLKA